MDDFFNTVFIYIRIESVNEDNLKNSIININKNKTIADYHVI